MQDSFFSFLLFHPFGSICFVFLFSLTDSKVKVGSFRPDPRRFFIKRRQFRIFINSPLFLIILIVSFVPCSSIRWSAVDGKNFSPVAYFPFWYTPSNDRLNNYLKDSPSFNKMWNGRIVHPSFLVSSKQRSLDPPRTHRGQYLFPREWEKNLSRRISFVSSLSFFLEPSSVVAYW